MQNSKIEWTDHTFNPWWGCVNVSPACDHCYAERFANRKTRTADPLWGKDSAPLVSSDHYWQGPVKWNCRAQRLGIRYRFFCGISGALTPCSKHQRSCMVCRWSRYWDRLPFQSCSPIAQFRERGIESSGDLLLLTFLSDVLL